ncbi:MAG: hypothetical protein R8K20_02710, partial [Gallionellaceae bacterium]
DNPPEDSWMIRGYQDEVDATIWGEKDVYDIRSMSKKTALDGTYYRDWLRYDKIPAPWLYFGGTSIGDVSNCASGEPSDASGDEISGAG